LLIRLNFTEKFSTSIVGHCWVDLAILGLGVQCVAAMLPASATSWVHYTTSCNTQSSAPEDGQDHRPKHVELIWIINKLLLLHLVGFFIIYINDARSNKYQISV